jgi:hypothetical protein
MLRPAALQAAPADGRRMGRQPGPGWLARAAAGTYCEETFAPAGEVHVNPGGEPERDDTGLPPVDIEVPDDARELERDVQAYYREQKALRRHQRSMRLHGTLARDGMVVPLLVICLIFALIAGTLLTLFTATSINQNLQGPDGAGSAGREVPPTASSSARASASAATGASAAATGGASHPAGPALPRRSATGTHVVTSVPGKVAAATLAVDGTARPVRALRPAVLLLVPATCNCDRVIVQPADLALKVGAHAYIVATPAAASQAAQLVRLGHGLRPAADATSALGHGLRAAGLTAILVAPNGSMSYAQRLQDGVGLAAVLHHAGV